MCCDSIIKSQFLFLYFSNQKYDIVTNNSFVVGLLFSQNHLTLLLGRDLRVINLFSFDFVVEISVLTLQSTLLEIGIVFLQEHSCILTSIKLK